MTTLAQVTLLTAGADSADNQSNGFYVSDSGISEANMDSWTTALQTFYSSLIALQALKGLAQNNHIVKFYDVGGAPPNYPVYETTWNFANANPATDLPQEVALAVSYKNNSNNSVPRARRRGRIYISGWSEARNTAGRPTNTAYESLATAYADYCDDVNVIAAFTAVIYSRVQDITNNVEEVWCDNEWDTVRRRGGVATIRSTALVTP